MTGISVALIEIAKHKAKSLFSIDEYFESMSCRKTIFSQYSESSNLIFSLVSAFSQKNKTYKTGLGVCVCL